MYTDRELDEYNQYMDWVRENITEEEDRKDPRFSTLLIDIDEIQLVRSADGTKWRHHWSITYSDGHMVVGQILMPTFDDWLSVKRAEHRDAQIDLLLNH